MNYEKILKDALNSKATPFEVSSWIEEQFPELAESEDEKVRKKILFLFYAFRNNEQVNIPNKKEVEKAIDWLEKQGENENLVKSDSTSNKINKDVISYADKYSHQVWLELMDKFDKIENYSIGCNDVSDIVLNAIINTYNWLEKQGKNKPVISDDALREGIAHFGITQYQIDNWLKKYVDVEKQAEQEKDILEDAILDGNEDGLIAETIRYKNEKHGDHNSTNKVEPKFKVGDWVVVNGETLHIKKVIEGGYLIEEGGFIPFRCEKEARPWTIKDAKDGDVLWHSDTASNGIFIFKEIRYDGKVLCYCDYDSEDHFCLGEYHTCCWVNDKYIKPATKEQRDLLFQKMHEAGYEFDFENKELKKIEQKPAWSKEDEFMVDNIVSALKPLSLVIHSNYAIKGMINWLKSLKDKAQPQPKQEWSEEEIEKAAQEWDSKANFNPFYMTMEGDRPIGVKQHITTHKESFKAGINWILNSLRPQNHWKPSEGDIIILEKVIKGELEPKVFQATLQGILEQLKRLKEE